MDERSRRLERAFEVPLTIAALLVLPDLALQASDVGAPWDTVGVVLDWGIWLAFVAEVVTMLAVVPDRERWARDHLVDLAIVVLTPPFLAALAPIRLLRLVRVLRLLRLAPLARHLFTAQGLRNVALFAVITAVAGGAAFADFEGDSTANGIYWAVTTMTTVGYGNPEADTTGGKITAVLVMLVGIGFIALLTGAIAQRFLGPDIQRETEAIEEQIEPTEAELLRQLREMSERLQALEAAVRARGIPPT